MPFAADPGEQVEDDDSLLFFAGDGLPNRAGDGAAADGDLAATAALGRGAASAFFGEGAISSPFLSPSGDLAPGDDALALALCAAASFAGENAFARILPGERFFISESISTRNTRRASSP